MNPVYDVIKTSAIRILQYFVDFVDQKFVNSHENVWNNYLILYKHNLEVVVFIWTANKDNIISNLYR